MAEKYYYYKFYIYLRSGRPVSGIRHHTSNNLNVVKGLYEDEARRHYQEKFWYMDMWKMDERFLEVIAYKEEKGLK